MVAELSRLFAKRSGVYALTHHEVYGGIYGKALHYQTGL